MFTLSSLSRKNVLNSFRKEDKLYIIIILASNK